jgi:hypothetical protein
VLYFVLSMSLHVLWYFVLVHISNIISNVIIILPNDLLLLCFLLYLVTCYQEEWSTFEYVMHSISSGCYDLLTWICLKMK